MSSQRHVVRRFDSDRVQDFDEQFWPVVLAVCVLAAFTVGSILTMLRGPWMWGSLLAIPIFIGLGLLALSYIEQRFWRRSVQIGMLLSISFHLFVMIVAYQTGVFGGREKIEIASDPRPAPIEQLEISVTPSEAIWNQPNPIETPQTELSQERQPNSQTSQAEPARDALAEAAQSNPSPSAQRRESSGEITPQSGRSLSEKSRNVEKTSRKSRELSVASAAPMSSSAATELTESTTSDQVDLERTRPTEREPRSINRRQADPEAAELAQKRSPTRREERPAQPASAAARQSRRNAEFSPDPTTAPAQPTRESRVDSTAERTRRDLPAADVSATRKESAPSLTRASEDTAAPAAVDRQAQRSESAQIADAMTAIEASSEAQRPRQARAPTETSVVAESEPAAPVVSRMLEPSPESNEVSRQQIQDRQYLTHAQPSDEVSQTPTDQSPRRLTRRTTDVERPSDQPATGAQPRVARERALTPTTTESIESPAVASTTGQMSRSALEPRPLALNRATGGVSGVGRSANFGRAADSAPSPAAAASDSARRAEAESQSEVAETLSPSQASRLGRSTVGLDSPQAALPATPTFAGDQAGGREPQPIGASAAASVTSANAAGRRSEVSADVGSADLDLGPTKIVSGAARSESSGGGQPELVAAKPSSTGAANRSGSAQASIVADTIADSVAANLTEGSGQPPSPRGEPNAAAAVAQRRGGTNAQAQGPSRAELTGEPGEFSSGAVQNPRATSRASRRSSRGSEGAESETDDQSGNERRATIARQVITDGPSTEGQPNGLGQFSGAAETSDEAESARSDLARANRPSNALGAVSPSRAEANDGLSGNSQVPSNSLQRRGEDAPDTAGESIGMATVPERSAQGLELEVASGSDGSEFSRGMATNAQPSNDESAPRSLESERATGTGVESLGPSAKRNAATAATSERLVDGSGRAEATSASDLATEGKSSTATRSRSAALAADNSAVMAGPANNGAGAVADPEQRNDRVSQAQRTESAQAHVDIDWDEGAGGLGQTIEADIGVPSRQASPDSDIIAFEPSSRFRRRTASGELAVSPAAQLAKESFQGRNPGRLGQSGPQTERAIELGLAFLIRYQHADGHWSLLDFDEKHPLRQHQLDSDTAATGLAILAFQGAGYTHREFKYAERVNRGIEWLVSHQRPSGDLYVESDQESNKNCQLYSHAIASLALAEAFGMTQDPNIREAAQKAIDFIVETQDPKLGGWRYFSTPGQRSTDTSVTGWMVMALHSGRLAGLDVDPNVWKGIESWMTTAQAPDSESQYVYSPYVHDDPSRRIVRSHLRRPANSTTAIGLLMRMYTGWKQDDPRLMDGANVLLKQLPSEFNIDVRDTYYWYYATQVLRHVDGPTWQAWNSVLHPLLLSSQIQDGEYAGSWDPYEPVEDKYGKVGGRLYVTTLNLLSLEVDYRLLPLYDKTIAPRDKSN